ncbi:MAG: radical SAM protein [Candidatus Omnitrophica bacterium]|nr:radical SAM protein [Candidatus Omnitrophota bacterium]
MHAERPKIALVTTSLLDLGIRSLKATLDKNNFQTQLYLLDAMAGRYSRSELNQVLVSLENFAPSVIGISTLEYSLLKTRQLLQAIRLNNAFKQCLCVAGGIGATLSPEDYIDLTDAIVIGEGEDVFLELIQKFLNNKEINGIKNSWVKINGIIFKNPLLPISTDLNCLPIGKNEAGAYRIHNGRLLRLKEGVFTTDYKPWRKESIFIFESRGCAHNCSFCIYGHNHTGYTKQIRRRGVSQILEHLEREKKSNPSLKLVHLIENDFLSRSQEEIEEFAQGYKTKIALPYFIYCTPENTTVDKLSPLVDSGLRSPIMGVQSGSERIKKYIYNRPMDNQMVLKATEAINKFSHKIKPMYDFIINNPYEKKEDILDTINLIHLIPKPFIVSNHCLVFFKGTDLYKKAWKDKISPKIYYDAEHDYHDARYYLNNENNLYLNSFMLWLERMQIGLHKMPSLYVRLRPVFISTRTCRFMEKIPVALLLANSGLLLISRLKEITVKIIRSMRSHCFIGILNGTFYTYKLG